MRTIRIRNKSRARSDRLPAGDPVEALGLLAAGVTKSWRGELDRRLYPMGLTRVQWQALRWLDRAGGELVQGELAGRLDIGAPATVALVDRMQRDGLVVRREVRATLSDAELETLCALLTRVRGGLEALSR